MNLLLVLRVLGYIAFFIGLSMLMPLPFAYYYGDGDASGILISALITLALGGLSFISKKKNDEIRPKEGFAVVTLSWIVFGLLGSLPYVLSGAIPSFTDAFFETMSGFTTTGATILTEIESLPHGILFWRSLTHWLGGMGIIVLSIAILPFLGVGGFQLFKAEAPGPVADKLKPRVTETAKILWVVYAGFTLLETILLLFGGMDFFDAICHSFATLATGGYSTKNTSVAYYGSAYIDYVIIIFMIIAGTNFSLHYRLIKGDFKRVFKNSELRFYLSLIVAATIIIGLDIYLHNYGNFADSLRYGLFQVAAIITTTGFGTADYEQWSVSSQLILFSLMFVGGMAGSTGGGMKVMRVLLLIKFGYNELVKLIHPQAVIPIRINGNVVDTKIMINVAGYFVTFALIGVASAILLSMMGIDIITSISLIAATMNNIGPGLGMVGPTDNYGFLPIAAKWLLSFLMLIGRLELFTVLILLAPSFWKK